MDSIAGNIELSQQMLDAIKRVIDDHFFSKTVHQCIQHSLTAAMKNLTSFFLSYDCATVWNLLTGRLTRSGKNGP